MRNLGICHSSQKNRYESVHVSIVVSSFHSYIYSGNQWESLKGFHVELEISPNRKESDLKLWETEIIPLVLNYRSYTHTQKYANTTKGRHLFSHIYWTRQKSDHTLSHSAGAWFVLQSCQRTREHFCTT